MELKGQNIIIFSLFRFDADIESTSLSLARELSRNNQVFYFDNPYTLNDVIRRIKTPAFRRRRGFFSLFSDRSVKLEKGLEVFIPPVVLSLHFLPEGWLYRKLLRLNEWLIQTKIRFVLRKRGIRNYIFINSFNFHYPGITSSLSPALRVYHCLDPILGEFDSKHGLESERILTKNSDLIICSAKQLYEEKKRVNPNTFFVPNADLPSPVVGYFGSIDHRMDLDLLEAVVRRNPDKSFVLLGPLFAPLPESLQACTNIFFRGKVAYADMPSVLKGFNVAIIPFKKDSASGTVFPLKLFEYLGAGKPVISTDFNPDLRDFTGNMVAYCEDAKAFSDALEFAITTDSDTLRKQRTDLASAHTWAHRSETISGILRAALAP
jgi:teichuronic acid biosynthesis glycosyltransferase TuaH